MKVVHTGSWQFYVESADGDGFRYMVDLKENGGIGVCNCPDFAARCQPRIDAGAPVDYWPSPRRLTCKHINAAELFAVRESRK